VTRPTSCLIGSESVKASMRASRFVGTGFRKIELLYSAIVLASGATFTCCLLEVLFAVEAAFLFTARGGVWFSEDMLCLRGR